MWDSMLEERMVNAAWKTSAKKGSKRKDNRERIIL
jgi:hypothetical protein